MKEGPSENLDIVERVEEIENRLFPGKFSEYKQTEGRTPNRPNCYSFFAPSHHFETGLMTESIVEDLTRHRDKKILFVGSGPANLEMIVIELGVRPDQIVVSDIDPLPIEGPLSERCATFDMLHPWPRFENSFEYVIFPESFPGLPIPEAGERITQRTKNITFVLKQALQVLQPNGVIQLNYYTERNAKKPLRKSVLGQK